MQSRDWGEVEQLTDVINGRDLRFVCRLGSALRRFGQGESKIF